MYVITTRDSATKSKRIVGACTLASELYQVLRHNLKIPILKDQLLQQLLDLKDGEGFELTDKSNGAIFESVKVTKLFYYDGGITYLNVKEL